MYKYRDYFPCWKKDESKKQDLVSEVQKLAKCNIRTAEKIIKMVKNS